MSWTIKSLGNQSTEKPISPSGKWTIKSLGENPHTIASPQPESWKQFGLRTGARTLARGAESIAGLPGDVTAGIQSGIDYLSGSSPEQREQERIQQKEQFVQRQQELQQKGEQEQLTFPEFVEYALDPQHLVSKKQAPIPTSELIREKVTKPLTGEYLEPKTKSEEFYDTVIGDMAAFSVPFKGAKQAAKALGVSLGSNAAAKLAESVGVGKTGQAGVKLATILGSQFIGFRPKMETERTKLYDLAEKAIKPNETVKAATFKNNLTALLDSMEGYPRPILNKIAPYIDSAQELIVGNEVPIKALWNQKKSLNQIIKKPGALEPIVPQLKQLVGIQNELLNSAKKVNPEFGKYFSAAEDIHKGLQKSAQINNFVKKSVNLKSLKSDIAKLLIGGASYLVGGKKGVATAAALGYLTKKSAETLNLLKNSKEALKYAGKMYAAAAAKNTAAVNRYAQQIDKIAEQKNKKRITNRQG